MPPKKRLIEQLVAGSVAGMKKKNVLGKGIASGGREWKYSH